MSSSVILQKLWNLPQCIRGEEKQISFINVNLIAILESKYPRQSVIPICQPARARTAVRITTQLVKASDRDAKWKMCIHDCAPVVSDTPVHSQAHAVANKYAGIHTHRGWSTNVSIKPTHTYSQIKQALSGWWMHVAVTPACCRVWCFRPSAYMCI